MEISMNIKKKILGITIAPVIILGLISMFLTTTMVRSAMLEEIEEALRGTAAATLAAYDQNTGDYLQTSNGDIWTADHDSFLESMADAASSVVDYFKGNAVYINVMKNMSVDCDCCAVAEDPCMEDMGILISTDPIAIDQACLDLVYASDDPGRDHLLERIESRHGVHTIEAAAALGFGTREYELITVA